MGGNCRRKATCKSLSQYLDHNAATPVDRRVLEKMRPYFCEVYGKAFQTIRLGLGRSIGDPQAIADMLIDGIGPFVVI